MSIECEVCSIREKSLLDRVESHTPSGLGVTSHRRVGKGGRFLLKLFPKKLASKLSSQETLTKEILPSPGDKIGGEGMAFLLKLFPKKLAF